MQSESDEREDIVKLLHGAFVRVCRLAIADCGVSVAELTLHLSIQLNTGMQQILSTTLVETVRSPLDEDSNIVECSAANRLQALNKVQHTDDDDVDGHINKKESFDRSFNLPVDVDDVEPSNFNKAVTAPPSVNRPKGTFTAVAKDSKMESRLQDVSSGHSLIFSTDNHRNIAPDELLANDQKSSKWNSESPMMLLESASEVDKVYERRTCASLSNVSSSKDVLVTACILSTLPSFTSNMLDHCTTANCVEDTVCNPSDEQCETNNASFLQHCQFEHEHNAACSDSAYIAVESQYCSLDGEFIEKTAAGDEVSGGSDCTEIEVDGPASSNSSLYDKTADGSSNTSYEEQQIVDESDTHSCHVVASESPSNSLCSPVNRHPPCGEADSAVQDVLLPKLYPPNYFLSSVCSTYPTADASDSYSQQPDILSINTSGYELVKSSANNAAHKAQETEFQKILSSISTNAAVVTTDAKQGKYLYYARAPCGLQG